MSDFFGAILERFTDRDKALINFMIEEATRVFNISKKDILISMNVNATYPRMSCYVLLKKYTKLSQQTIGREIFNRTQELISMEITRFYSKIYPDKFYAEFNSQHDRLEDGIKDFILQYERQRKTF